MFNTELGRIGARRDRKDVVQDAERGNVTADGLCDAHARRRSLILRGRLPPFRQHPLFPGGHAQTLAGVFLPGRNYLYGAAQHRVRLSDGDEIVLHDDCPDEWRPGMRTALLIHGLAGCHLSSYMQRVAAKLAALGLRVFRMDLRGCGAGFGLARLPYHSGRSEDAAAALEEIAQRCPASSTTLVGFSLGGNITLKLLGELGEQTCGGLDSAVAICPPIDLQAAIERIALPLNRLYDRHFIKLLLQQARERQRVLPDAPPVNFARPPRGLWEFDDGYTAPVSGFGDAANYYRQASSARLIPNIRRPTLVIASRDDPLVPWRPFLGVETPDCVQVEITERGGHLGYVARAGADPDRRWLDWRIVEWIAEFEAA
ncbi:MAG TPA: alpha/beta fold hydrolase [Pirellulales bacterium]|jgi:predicted alpha/beta-fold hydrolase|nr:alpha/beta fold hydrolase [Pirellulales bacterium]